MLTAFPDYLKSCLLERSHCVEMRDTGDLVESAIAARYSRMAPCLGTKRQSLPRKDERQPCSDWSSVLIVSFYRPWLRYKLARQRRRVILRSLLAHASLLPVS